jgi:hypothetical protein
MKLLRSKTTPVPLKDSMNRSPLWCTFLCTRLIVSVALVGLVQLSYAQCPQICDANGNTALGDDTLLHNTVFYNTAVGSGALQFNTTGGSNTATGVSALNINTTGSFNTATGVGALVLNTTGTQNTAIGMLALGSNLTGSYNTATGYGALHKTTGGSNTATGFDALRDNGNGSNNTATGWFALIHNKGSGNIALGAKAGGNLTSGNNNIDIGNDGVRDESNTIRIGSRQTGTFIAGISGVTVAGGIGVIVDSSGHLGTTTSSARFKEAIRPMDKTSQAILSLKPVTFRYKHELDPQGVPQFGLVAEDVEKVNPDLVARDEQGKPYTVRYDAVNTMLLNEFLKEHKAFLQEQRKVEKLETTVTQQRKDFEAAVAELKGQFQKVSARLELSRSAPKSIANNQ